MASVKLFDKYGNEIDHLTQWDMNVTLKITDFNYDIAPVCHFAKRYDKEAITVTSTLSDNTVSVVVPNILLSDENKRAEPIKMYVFLYESEEKSGRTIYVIDLPVETKPKPNDYEYEDNVEVVQLSELRVKLEALIARAEGTIDTKIDELGNSYQATITEIKESIQDDVDNLNRQITNSNTALINEIRASESQLSSEITEARTNLNTEITNSRTSLNAEIQAALNTLINGIRDGSPKGVFTDVSELAEKESGIYLCVNSQSNDDGYIFYWDGETLSDRLLYYAGMIINDGTITYEKFADSLKQKVGTIVYYTLKAYKWINKEQEMNISSNVYNVTENTNAIIHLDSDTYDLLSEYGCESLSINNSLDGHKLIAQIEGNVPDVDFTIQLTLVDN